MALATSNYVDASVVDLVSALLSTVLFGMPQISSRHGVWLMTLPAVSISSLKAFLPVLRLHPRTFWYLQGIQHSFADLSVNSIIGSSLPLHPGSAIGHISCSSAQQWSSTLLQYYSG